MRIEHPDTFRCDLCGTEVESDEVFKARLLVLFNTERNEGRSNDPYVRMVWLALCPECLDRYTTVEASGAVGSINSYRWRDGR